MNEKTRELAIMLLRTYILRKAVNFGNIFEEALIALSIASKVFSQFIVQSYHLARGR